VVPAAAAAPAAPVLPPLGVLPATPVAVCSVKRSGMPEISSGSTGHKAQGHKQ
jgi:hypothetical protein